ncbi:MAG: acetyl-CoA carboxylase carboxyltransferase subunit beta [Chloroflexi bacterium]|nr:acetyl-CoA carboxylase carboxyltransferase subunit beta [Chloroflexota bacterium]
MFKRTAKPGEAEANATEQAKTEHNGPLPKFTWNQGSGAADAGSPPAKVSESKKPAKLAKIPDNLWTRCPACKELIYTKELENNKKVCQKCNHHFRLKARERINLLVDEGSFEEINSNLISADPLDFVSLTEPPYPQKMAEVRQKTGLNEAVITGFGQLQGLPLGLVVCDFSFQGGSMGGVFGEKLVRLVEEAIRRRCPVLTVSASGGARMHEGLFSLMQMAKTTAAINRLGEAGLPHISLLTDPCTGGVFASYASVADIIMAEPGAFIGFAGPRIIEQITKQKLPTGFNTAEFLLEHGMVDRVIPRKELASTLEILLRLYGVASAQIANQKEASYAR